MGQVLLQGSWHPPLLPLLLLLLPHLELHAYVRMEARRIRCLPSQQSCVWGHLPGHLRGRGGLAREGSAVRRPDSSNDMRGSARKEGSSRVTASARMGSKIRHAGRTDASWQSEAVHQRERCTSGHTSENTTPSAQRFISPVNPLHAQTQALSRAGALTCRNSQGRWSSVRVLSGAGAIACRRTNVRVSNSLTCA